MQSEKNQEPNKQKLTTGDIIHWTLLILLIAITITFRLNGTLWCPDHEVIIIQTDQNGQPTNMEQVQELEARGIIQPWTEKQKQAYQDSKELQNINLTLT